MVLHLVGDDAQHLIAEFLVEDVVDDLEILDVNANDLVADIFILVQHFPDALEEVMLVVQAGERIVSGHVLLVREFHLIFGRVADTEAGAHPALAVIVDLLRRDIEIALFVAVGEFCPLIPIVGEASAPASDGPADQLADIVG